MDSVGHFSHEADSTSEGGDHQRTPLASEIVGRGVGRARSINRRMGQDSRERALVAAINRLEQEHVALLMALCELEESSDASQDALVRGARPVQAQQRDIAGASAR